MTVLVVSDDDDAAQSLCWALKRTRQNVSWARELASSRELMRDLCPLVLVADTAVRGHDELIEHVREHSPWTRVYLMADASARLPHALIPVVAKPFDAAELAELLRRDCELAELDRGRRNLLAQAEDLSLLVEASLEAIVGLNADGTIRSWNPGAVAVYGYQESEMLGRNVSVLESEQGALAARLAGATREAVEVRRKRRDGSDIIVLLSLSSVTVGRSRSFAFVEVSLDITQRRKLERELEHSERLAAIGRLAASMAHEINNPLAVIHASSSYVAEIAERSGDTELAECARDLDLAVERIGSFVQHVCGFARRERPQLSDASLTTAIDIAQRMVRPRARERGVELTVSPDAAPRVPHDPPRIAQAVVNLLSNAIDAAASGGHHVVVRSFEHGNRVLIQVDDDGPGIADEIKNRMFEPFATTKPHGQGTGLGLAITRQILLDHAGDVTVSSRAEGGTRAELVLPSLDVSAQRVLVVDADPAVRRALVADLRREGFDVLGLANLAAASQQITDKKPRVIVTDLVPPGSEDAPFMDELCFQSPETCWLVVTAQPQLGETPYADLVLAKPWDRSRLVAAVRQLCLAGA